jgi:hypothetical protein
MMRVKVFDLPFLDGDLIAAAEMRRYSACVRLNPCRKSTINKTPTFPNVIYLTLFHDLSKYHRRRPGRTGRSNVVAFALMQRCHHERGYSTSATFVRGVRK